jgi:hypothetical protein
LTPFNPYLHNGLPSDRYAADGAFIIGPFKPGDVLDSLVISGYANASLSTSVDIVMKSMADLANTGVSDDGFTLRGTVTGPVVVFSHDGLGGHAGTVELPVCYEFTEQQRFAYVRPGSGLDAVSFWWKWHRGK